MEEEWVLKLLDAASGNALKIAGSLGNLDAKQIQAAQSAMALQKAQQALAAAEASGNIAGRQSALDAMKRMQLGEAMKAARAQDAAQRKQERDAEKAAKDAERLAKKQAKDAEKAAKDAAKAQKDAQTGAVAVLKSPIDEATKALEGMGPKGAAAAMAIKAAFAVAAIAITVTVGTLYKMAEAALEVVAQRAKLLATFSALSFGSVGGAKTLAIVEKLGVSLPFATSKIAEWATGLQKAGFQGRALESAIKAVAAAEALVEGGGAAAQNLLTTLAKGGAEAMGLIATLKRGGPEARSQLADMGLRVQDLAAALGMSVAQFQRANLSTKQMAEAVEKALARKAAGPLADLFLTFPVLIQKVREGFLSLFDKMGPAVRPFMQAVKELFGQFSKGGGAINTLKPIVTGVLTTLFSWATKAVQALTAIVKAFSTGGKAAGVFGGAISVAKIVFGILISMAKLVAAPLMLVGKMLALIFSNATVLSGLKNIFTVIAVVIGTVVVIVATLVAIFASLVSGIAAGVGAIVGGVVGVVSGISGAITEGLGALDPSAFVEKMAGMARAGLAAFKNVLGIASPSKVLMKHADDDVAGGAAMGMDKGTDKVEAAADRMGAAMVPSGGKGGAKRGGGTGDHYHFHYAGPADEADTFFDKAAQWLQALSDSAPAPEGT